MYLNIYQMRAHNNQPMTVDVSSMFMLIGDKKLNIEPKVNRSYDNKGYNDFLEKFLSGNVEKTIFKFTFPEICDR